MNTNIVNYKIQIKYKIKKVMIADENQIEVRQNAGDEASPLTCSPECPQVNYFICGVSGLLFHGSSLVLFGFVFDGLP